MRITILLVLSLVAVQANARSLAEYLPGQDYDPAIPKPADVLGFEVGQWFARPDQLVRYMQVLAEASPRVGFQVIGHSHESRPQVLLTISTPENLARIDTLRDEHLAHARGQRDDGPLVLWFGYSIHGDEASGSNASMLFAYHLAALPQDQARAVLADTVILIDPSLNPDGMGRYAQWANGNRSVNPVAGRVHREHNQPWVRGRYNHYWFDLNRDWLLLTHPESRNRVRVLQDWRPHVITDFHETRSHDSYFFQPGVPFRTHPLTPPANQQLTAAIARHHARAFDARGEIYFTREVYDDFYYGKGSTYPDVQGMIGILFEQPSSRGQLLINSNGELSFAHAIDNHLATSLSTLAGAREQRQALLDYPAWFLKDATEKARSDRHAAYLFGEAGDPARGRAMADILLRHGIQVRNLIQPHTVDGQRFIPGAAWAVILQQSQYRLIQAVFERRTEFADNTFYDVSTWTFPLAFDLPVAPVKKLGDWLGETLTLDEKRPQPMPEAEAQAWALPWNRLHSARALERLHQAGVQVRVAVKPLRVRTADGERDLPRGTLLIPGGLNRSVKDLPELLRVIVTDDELPITAITSGQSINGPDLGSSSQKPLRPVRPLLLGGRGVNVMEAGEVWHLLDQRIGLPLTVVEKSRFDAIRWADFSHLLMVEGKYDDLNEEQVARIRDWVRQGGILVASKSASAWATTKLMEREPEEKTKQSDQVTPRPYGELDNDAARAVIGGAFVQGQVDLSHPLAFGLAREQLALFRNGTTFLAPSSNPYETVIRYSDEPLLSGFLGPERRAQLAASAALIASRMDRGLIVRLADNPNFRGFMYGTHRLYFNALYLASIVNKTPVADTETRL
jgi:hypothetical protein